VELKNKFGDERERISVLDSYGVQCMVLGLTPHTRQRHWKANG